MRTNRNNVTENAEFKIDRDKYAENFDQIDWNLQRDKIQSNKEIMQEVEEMKSRNRRDNMEIIVFFLLFLMLLPFIISYMTWKF